jgi:glucosamine--fructose-6-phosphate aminotransferase (isomerizing)
MTLENRTTSMAREIAEQPDTLAATLDALLPLRPEVRRLAASRGHLLLAARGSSDNAAWYGRYLLEIHTGYSATLAAPSPGLSRGVVTRLCWRGRPGDERS